MQQSAREGRSPDPKQDIHETQQNLTNGRLCPHQRHTQIKQRQANIETISTAGLERLRQTSWLWSGVLDGLS